MILKVKTGSGEYPIFLERGGLSRLGERICLNRKCMIVSDENIPAKFKDRLAKACGEPYFYILPPGEDSKCLRSFEECLGRMLEAGFTRTDCVIALGGGVVGDLAGFVASAYLRGVDFYNVPTTVLSQVDSSIGGKVAVNFRGLKNMVGAFYPPKAVLIDSETLETLPTRQIANGLAESVKMGLSLDEELFSFFEEDNFSEKMDRIIEKSLCAKRRVVEEDEREGGLRKVLNFGHTLAHAFESESFRLGKDLYHGEAVALGMIPMCSPEVRKRLIPVLERLQLPTRWEGSPEDLIEAMSHDKKMEGSSITVIRSDRVGSFRMEKIPFSRLAEEVKGWAL